MGVRGRALVIAGTAAVVILVIVAIVVWPGRGQAQTSQTPRLPGTPHPNLSGVWQALNEANWDLEGHAARTARVLHPGVPNGAPVPAAQVLALGATGGMPSSIGVVDGGQI